MHKCAYTVSWGAEWDGWKAEANLRKHGITLADATLVVADLMGVLREDDHSGEKRYVVLGRDALGRILVVVYTWRGDTIRIISARKAKARERRQYFKGS
jgi:uncharacterized DUF497 family protein